MHVSSTHALVSRLARVHFSFVLTFGGRLICYNVAADLRNICDCPPSRNGRRESHRSSLIAFVLSEWSVEDDGVLTAS